MLHIHQTTQQVINGKLMRVFYLFVVGLVFTSCGGGLSDFIDDLGGGYYYLGEGGDYSVIYYSAGEKRNIDEIIIHAKIIKYIVDNEYVFVKQKPSLRSYQSYMERELSLTTDVHRNVDNFGVDSLSSIENKIYSKTLLDSSFYRKLYESTTTENLISDQEYFRYVADSLIKVDPSLGYVFSGDIQYWIILKKEKRVLGPFSEDKFEVERVKLNIPEGINFN